MDKRNVVSARLGTEVGEEIAKIREIRKNAQGIPDVWKALDKAIEALTHARDILSGKTRVSSGEDSLLPPVKTMFRTGLPDKDR